MKYYCKKCWKKISKYNVSGFCLNCRPRKNYSNYCIDCGKSISVGAKRCCKCYGISEKNRIFSPEHREKIRLTRLKKKKYYYCKSCGKEISKGHKICKSCYNQILSKKDKIGIKNPNYKHGLCAKWNKWATDVKKRDNYTCQLCGIQIIGTGTKRRNIHAHHIKPRNDYPELQYDINNGITLCRKCHFKTERYSDNLELQLENKQLKNEIKGLKEQLCQVV